MSALPCGCDLDLGHECAECLTKAYVMDFRKRVLAVLEEVRENWNHDDKGWLAANECIEQVSKLDT